MNFDLTTVHNFITIAESGGFSKASEILHVSRQVLNKQLNRLEAELGCELFFRSHSTVTLTAAGNTYYLFFKSFLEEYERFRIGLESISKKETAPDILRLGLLYGEIPAPRFSELLHRFQDQNPETQIIIETYEAYELQKLLLEHHLDLIVNYSFEINPSRYINTIDLGKARPCIFAAKAYPGIRAKRTFRDFASDPCFISASALFSPHNQIMSFRRLWSEHGISFNNVKILPNLRSIMANIELGTGVTLMTETSAFARNKDIRSFPLEDEITFSCVWNNTDSNPKLLQLTAMLWEEYEHT